MRNRITPRLTYANVVSSIALFAVLGGGAYAASKIGPSDIAKNAIRSKHVKDRSLRAKDLKAGQLAGVRGLVRVGTASSLQGSESVKFAMAICPEGKRVIGSGADIRAGVTGDPPDQLTDVVINEIIPSEETVVPGTVTVRAYEIPPGTTEEWGVTAFALCA